MTENANWLAHDILRHIEARLPKDASSTDIERIRHEVVKLLQAASTLRAFPLTNADEPEPIFRAYRHPD